MRLIDAEPLESMLLERAVQCSNIYGSLAGAVAGCLKLVQTQPAISPLPNRPLTLEELLEMDGEPVWVDFSIWGCPAMSCWMLVCVNRHCVVDRVLGDLDFESYGKMWLAYRRKPEEWGT